MKTAEDLLMLLGVNNYTKRHLKIINDFIKSEDEDIKKLLDQLGVWDNNDLKRAEFWMRSNISHPTLPSDEEIYQRMLKRKYVTPDGEIGYQNGMQDMRSIASAKLAEVERGDRFTQGYMCAMAAMMHKTGESTPLTETVSENFTTISELKKAGVAPEDIETLKPIFKEIDRKRKLNL